MTDQEKLKTVLKKLSLEDKLDEVQSKHNVFGPTTKFSEGKLIWLDLSNLGIKALPEQIFDELTDLQELDIVGSRITGKRPKDLQGLTQLRRLSLARCPITDSGLQDALRTWLAEQSAELLGRRW